MASKRGNEKDKINDDKCLGTEISILNTPHSLSFETDQPKVKRLKRRRVSSSDRYISQLSPSTKIQYINDCKIISNGTLPVSQQTSPLIADRSSSPGANSVNSTNLASSNFFNTPSKANPSKSYFPSPPSTGMSMKRLTRTFHQSTPSKKHESVMKDLERIAMANPSLFYASQKNSSAGIKQRIQDIAKTPEMVLDAPNFRDDYYTTLLSWGPNGNMLVGLNDECFLWNQDGLLSKVYQATRPDYIVSVDFCPTGSLAAIGTDDGNIKIFNLDLSDEIPQHSLYVPQLSILKWKNEQTLLTGFADGILRIYDVRNSTRPSSILSGYHDDKICGLARAGNSHLFSVGGNEGIVTVWDDRKLNAPVWNITSHSSAVRAMKWCPWASYILATGGGLDDESIQFHSTDSGKLLRTLPTGSQVCDLVWSTHYKEFVSAQNSINSQICIWRYPSLEKIISLPGHALRPMHLALSPDGQTVASLGDDEALKFWKCFPFQKGRKGTKSDVDVVPGLTIR